MELIYFAGMPLTLLLISVLYHMGYDILDIDDADQTAAQMAPFTIPLMIVLWPLVLFALIAVAVCFCTWGASNVTGKFIARQIMKVWKPK